MMKRLEDGTFGAEIQASGKELDFCFKDAANHWDNNNGQDWNLTLQ